MWKSLDFAQQKAPRMDSQAAERVIDQHKKGTLEHSQGLF